MAEREQAVHGVGPDEAGTPGDEHPHCRCAFVGGPDPSLLVAIGWEELSEWWKIPTQQPGKCQHDLESSVDLHYGAQVANIRNEPAFQLT